MQTKAIRLLKQDATLAQVISRVQLPPAQPSGDIYYDLLKSIISQQLSVKAAATIYDRFLGLFQADYPHPQKVLAFETEALRAVGLSRQKSGYIQNVANYFQEAERQQLDWQEMPDEEIVQQLTQIKGVGRWTVEMILMFTLDRPDVFPIDDLGIQQAIQGLYQLEGDKKSLRRQYLEVAEVWRPHRTLACRYLWRWKDE